MIEIAVGQKVISKKTHPCGGNVWTVERIGTDFKFSCDTCGRVVMLPRSKAEKFVKKVAENE